MFWKDSTLFLLLSLCDAFDVIFFKGVILVWIFPTSLLTPYQFSPHPIITHHFAIDIFINKQTVLFSIIDEIKTPRLLKFPLTLACLPNKFASSPSNWHFGGICPGINLPKFRTATGLAPRSDTQKSVRVSSRWRIFESLLLLLLALARCVFGMQYGSTLGTFDELWRAKSRY